MTTTVDATIKLDPILMEQSEELFDELGMSLATAVTLFLRQAVRERAIPFRVGEPLPNAETRRAIEDARQGVGLSRPFSSVAELMADLDADD